MQRVNVVVSNLYIYAIDPDPRSHCIVDITGRLEIEFSDATTIDLYRAAGVGDGINIHDNYDTDIGSTRSRWSADP